MNTKHRTRKWFSPSRFRVAVRYAVGAVRAGLGVAAVGVQHHKQYTAERTR